MPESISIFLIVGIALALCVIVGGVALFFKMWRSVRQGQALIVTGKSGTSVSFNGKFVLPVINHIEFMDLSVKTIDISREGRDGLICQDNIRADIRVTFFVRVNHTETDVKRVAQMVGCERASTHQTLEELFGAKFSEALKTAGKQFEFEQLYTERQKFRDSIVRVIGDDLNGYTLEDVAIDYLEQTPLDSLDPNNILDAEGILKITERTEVKRTSTQEAVQRRGEKARQGHAREEHGDHGVREAAGRPPRPGRSARSR